MPNKTNGLANYTAEEIRLTAERDMPAWVAQLNNKEDMANSILAAGQEFLAVFEDVLIKYFNFTTADLKKLHKEAEPILRGVKEFEKHGLSMLSPKDVAIVADEVERKGLAGLMAEIGEVRFKKEKLSRAGLEYPVTMGATPFLKALRKRNKDGK